MVRSCGAPHYVSSMLQDHTVFVTACHQRSSRITLIVPELRHDGCQAVRRLSRDASMLQNIEFGIDCDSRVALVGPNGAGKTP